MNNVFAYEGESGFSGTWNNISSPRSFNKILLNVPQGSTHWMRYVSGSIKALQQGEVLKGFSSNIKCTLCGYVVENGIGGAADSGIIIVNNLTGSLETLSGDILIGSNSLGRVVINQNFIPILTTERPKAAIISTEIGPINFTLSGINPTVYAGSDYGIYLMTGQIYIIRGWNNVSNFSCINYSSGNNAVVKYELLY